jgi:hypothetical protein
MSAPQVTVFLPSGRSYMQLLDDISDALLLNIDELPPDFPFEFTAQRIGQEYLLIEYAADASEVIDEMLQWEKPSQEYKLLLKDCISCINIHFRMPDQAKKCLAIIGNYIGQLSSQSIFENGYGCLLRLSEVIERCSGDSNWSWEREAFPDIPGVADSEWSD